MIQRLWRLGMVAIIALVVAIPGAAPAKAINYNDYAFLTNNTVNYCFSNDFSPAQRTIISQGLNKWIGETPGMPTFAEGACFLEDVRIDAVEPAIIEGAAAATACDSRTGTLQRDDGTWADRCVHAIMYWNLNVYQGFYWGVDSQNCTVSSTGGGCKPDAKTIAAHEWGHILGLGHSWNNISNQDQYCRKGGFSTASHEKCEGAPQERMMYNYAGFEFFTYQNALYGSPQYTGGWDEPWQGYRRTDITGTDRAGIDAVFPTDCPNPCG